MSGLIKSHTLTHTKEPEQCFEKCNYNYVGQFVVGGWGFKRVQNVLFFFYKESAENVLSCVLYGTNFHVR